MRASKGPMSKGSRFEQRASCFLAVLPVENHGMDFGVALPQYDFSAPDRMIPWSEVEQAAVRAEELGFDSVWLSDHLFLDLARYGGAPGRYPALDPIAALSALAEATDRIRLGTLTLCVPLRPATVLAKQLATLDVACGGRLVVGLGAGWNEEEFREAGVVFGPPGQRLAHVGEAIQVLKAMFEGEPVDFRGRFEVAEAAVCRPRPLQRPHPPIYVGGKGDRLISLAARRADGWNTVWTWTPDAYRQRLEVLATACERWGRDPRSIRRSLGLYALIGRDHADVVRRYEALHETRPPGTAPDLPLDQWRQANLVGTPDQVAEQVALWSALGVDELIVTFGPPPFGSVGAEDLELMAEAMVVASR